MSYSLFRKKLANLDHIDDIYVELRGDQGNENIAGFFDVYDYALSPEHIPELIESLEEEVIYKASILSNFKRIANIYHVFCDKNNIQFAVTEDITNRESFVLLDTKSYIDLIHELPGTILTGRSPRPPRYPRLMSSYSVWHYTLDWACKCRDIDFIEVRDNVPRALLEVTGKLTNEGHLRNSLSQIRDRLSLQKRMMEVISTHLGIDGYFVIHTTDLSIFYIFDTNWNQVARLDQQRYVEWL